MLHTKLLIRRLAYVPWLLAAGLVLGWAGEAAAITLTLSQNEVREDAGTTEITVTAKAAAKVTADTYVTLEIGGATDSPAHTQLNKRYRIVLPTVKIAKDADSGTGTITFIPNNDKMRGTDYQNNGPGTWTVAFSTTDGSPTSPPDQAAQNDDLWIEIDGDAGAAATVVTSTYLWMRDDDKLSTLLTLSPDPSSLSKDAGPSDVKVTATLNGSMSKNVESFPLVFDPDFDRDGDGTRGGADRGFGTGADSVLTRDAHYGASTASLRIAKRKSKGEATISIDPKGTVGWIAVAGNTGHRNATTGQDTLYLEGVDLNGDGDTGDSFTAGANGLTETILDLDVNADGDKGDSANESELGIDLDGNFAVNDTPAEDTVIKEGSIKFGVVIETDVIAVTSAALANVKGDGLAADRDKIREDTGTQEIELTITLAKAATKDEEVRFTISEVLSDPEDTDSAPLGERDRDYIVSVADLTISAGQTSDKTTLTVIPDNNPGMTGDRVFEVSATVGGATSKKKITIVDVDTFTTNIELSADPKEIQEDADPDSMGVAVTITATLKGKTFDKDTQIRLALSADGTAVRDQNYTARIYSVTVDSGMVSGSREITIFPKANSITANKTIIVYAPDELKNEDEEKITIGTATITLKDVPPAPDAPAPEENKPSFSADDIAGIGHSY